MTSPPSPRNNPFHSNSLYDDDSDSDNPLPFPAALPRSDFLAPDFTPESYLSTLHNRHQTLEDLRSDLRSRSALISSELLDLVNANYEAFLGLGCSLRGGDEKVEGVRVGVLGFRREVEGVRDVVRERMLEVENLLEQKKKARRDVAVGRRLLEVEDRLVELEEALMVEPNSSRRDKDSDDESEDEEDEEDEDEEQTPASRAAATALSRLRKHAQRYLLLVHLTQQVRDHPFVTAQQPRISRVRNTLLLDLRTALKQAQSAGADGKLVLKFLVMYRELGEVEQGIGAVKGG